MTLIKKDGLSRQQAQQKLRDHGFNELPAAKPKSLWNIAWEVMREPMFLLLIACSVLYMLLGDYHEGLILLSTVSVIIGITFYQYQKTEKALEALKSLSAPRVLVIRDGIETRIPGREVVPDDLVVLNEGDRVGADGIVLESKNLTIDESILTGESVPVKKLLNDQDAQNLVYSGTLVTQGKGLVRITATGIHTEFGKIGTSLKSIGQADETRLQKEMKVLIRTLFIVGIGLSLLVITAFYFTHGNLIQSLLNGLAAAMAILPEEFPVILTVFLALGAWRLSKINVLTRRPSAIETLGSATVLCTDKTGTITQNKMEVAAVYDGAATIQRSEFASSNAQLRDVLLAASSASQEDSTDPMERAIRDAYQSISSENLPGAFVQEYPLSADLLAMTIVRNSGHGNIASLKGAPEAVFALCRLNEPERAKQAEAMQSLAQKGYRVLGVGACAVQTSHLPDSQRDFDFQFKGLLAFADPIRAEVPDAVQQCHGAGIRVIMITGDYPATAASIGEQIGLPQDGIVLSGDELKGMSDDALEGAIKKISIFARVVPEQKLRIVRALKKAGEVVAMTGDGVNDAPALKAADIGIAMGMKGTDVAREASSLVLLDDNFASIVAAIRRGRRIFDNLQKAMSYVMAIHIPIIGLTLIPALIPSIPLLLMPLHIVFMELLIDPSCSVAFEYEQEEQNIMSRPPRDPDAKFFSWRRILRSILHGVLLLGMVLAVYFMSIEEGHSVKEVRAITFCALIIGNIALILTTLSDSRPFYASFMERNYALLFILAIAALLLFLVVTVPFLQNLFAFEFPGYRHFGTSLVGAAIILVALELEKILRLKRKTSVR